MIGALFGGNDYVEVHSGLLNRIQTSWGADTINTYGGGGAIRGGNDNDTINIVGGQFEVCNGGPANDILTNWSSFAGNVAGGYGDDTLINKGGGGYFYGGPGSDVFQPWFYTPEGELGGMMFIMDYTPGVDSLDLSKMGNYDMTVLSTGIAIGFGGHMVCSLEGVYSL